MPLRPIVLVAGAGLLLAGAVVAQTGAVRPAAPGPEPRGAAQPPQRVAPGKGAGTSTEPMISQSGRLSAGDTKQDVSVMQERLNALKDEKKGLLEKLGEQSSKSPPSPAGQVHAAPGLTPLDGKPPPVSLPPQSAKPKPPQ